MSNKVVTRNSSVELFRILATFLVLIVHFNGWFVGGMPVKLTTFDYQNIGQALIEAASCTCVNCFLVITGWYGLKFKWKHVWTIWSILVWIYVPFYIIESIINDDFSILRLIFKMIALVEESYYVQCYLMLLFLSPILNSFIKRFGKKILPYTLAFLAIEIIFDWILGNKCLAFGNGYMLTHFIFMYLLGQTAFLYRDRIHEIFNQQKGIMIYILGILLITSMYIVIPADRAFAYSNPLNIIMSFALFFLFERKTFHSHLVNWIGASTLAVYMAHVTPPVINILQKWDVFVLTNYSYTMYLLIISATILGVFTVSILYDKIRIMIFKKPGIYICNRLSLKLKKYSLGDE